MLSTGVLSLRGMLSHAGNVHTPASASSRV